VSSLRQEFLSRLKFRPDRFQLEAIEALDAGKTVVVAAPTGSGKTLVAEYAVYRALSAGAKAFYTTPLKALSNQKYSDLAALHGPGRVGLLTGDNSINGDAPVVVMTTEVLRNMIYSSSPGLEGLRYVVLDEVHYLQDPYRGAVWEEVIIHAPPEVDLICLSATVSNAEEFAAWVQTVRGEAAAIIEERRPVELRHLFLVGDRNAGAIHVLPTFVDGRPNPEAAALDARARDPRRPAARFRSRLYTPRRVEVVEELEDRGLLPAIYFIFSRAGCDDAVQRCLEDGVRLTTPEEAKEIRAIAESKMDALSDSDLSVLGYGRWIAGLEAGVAPHHAGMVPPFKEAVEACFEAALVKVVFATETLSLGINMPARTVVIEKLTKFTGERHQALTPGDYTQLTGRAGRRGIDEVGYAAVLWSPFVPFEAVAALAARRTYELTSSFRPTYNMAANLIQRYPRREAEHLLNLSFAQFRADAQVVALEADLEHARHQLGRAQGALAGRPGARRLPAPAARGLARRVARLEAQVRRLEKRLRSQSQSLSAQLDRVVGLLEARGYVKAWSLTAAGQRLARLYHECDLLVAEALHAGLLDGLEPPELAALASAFTFEQRGASRQSPPRLPTARLRHRWAQLEALAAGLARDEEEAGLVATRPLDPGFARAAYRWVSGAELGRVVGEEEISGGDFVRNVKQLLDLLSQLALVAPGPQTAQVARQAAERAFRGVVAASSVVAPDQVPTGPPGGP